MPAPQHPDFETYQRRLRRLNPDWYPEPLAFDPTYGPGMARGLDAAFDMLEQAHGVTGPLIQPKPAPPAPPTGAARVPARFRFLLADPIAPLMVRVALDLIGSLETAGNHSNPVITAWADEIAAATASKYDDWAADFYNDDAVPWCGLFMAICALRSADNQPSRLPPDKYLSALAWGSWGSPVAPQHAAVGDVMVLKRAGGGHVTLCVGIEAGERRFFGLGGNQGDAVTIAPFDMARVAFVRRPLYRALPLGARRVIVAADGTATSTSEA